MAPKFSIAALLLTFYYTVRVVHTECTELMKCPSACRCDSNLRLVDCQGKHITDIPELPMNVSTILLNNNNIHEISESDFAKCSNLRSLDVSHNKLDSVRSTSFQEIQQLSHLYLHNNLLDLSNTNSSLPWGVLDPLTSLVGLQLHGNIWNHTAKYREDLARKKPRLESLSLDSPKGLVELPPVFSTLRSLRTLAVHGGITGIQNDTFSVLATLSLMDVSFPGGQLKCIDANALSHFPMITSLDLSYNRQLGLGPKIQSALFGLRSSPIQRLNLASVCTFATPNTPPIVENFFQHLIDTPLTELYLDDNGLNNIETKFHSSLPHLQKLSLSYNRIFGYVIPLFNDTFVMPNISFLDISMQSLFSAPRERQSEDADGFASRYDYFLFPPRLRTLNVSRGLPMLDMVISRLFFITNTSYMDILDVSHNTIGSINEGLYVLPPHPLHIDYLNLSFCEFHNISFDYAQITIDTIDLSNNILGRECSTDKHGVFLSHIAATTEAKRFFLSANGIKHLPVDFFSKAPRLERIRLNQNALRVWNSSLRHMPNLTHLDLSDNLLSSLSGETCEELDNFAESHPFSLNLDGNPLICSCYTRYFLRWMKNSPVRVIGMSEYECDMNNKIVTLRNISHIIRTLDIQCTSETLLIVTGAMLGLLLVLIGVSIVLYRHRFDIKYACLKLTRERKEDQRANIIQYKYDAFVAVHHKDMTWVVHTLLPRLEQGPHFLSLCIHHRDWLPGPTIEENISRSVAESRKTLVVLSKQFIQSGWCDLELQLARMRGLDEGEDIIVVVALEDIPMREMSTTLSNLRRSHTWLDWVEYENDREQFWELLTSALVPARGNRSRSSVRRHESVVSDEELLAL